VEVKVDKRYPLDVDPARAWVVLQDLSSVTVCMPGAELTEQVDERRYKGKVKVKVGPATANFDGDVEMLAVDIAARQIRLNAKGVDKGGSSAAMDLTALIEAVEDPAKSVLVGRADVIVNGKFAQFGGRMMGQVSDMILGQFAGNFGAAAAALPVPTQAGGAAEPRADAAAARAALSEQNRELNAFAMFWQLVKNWFGGLFGKRGG
jgi:carbon monoxide dehydrogenase subunit G